MRFGYNASASNKTSPFRYRGNEASLRFRPILHPFLFALYPAVAMLAFNISWVPLADAWRALVAGMGLAAVVFLLLWLVLRQPLKAALITTLFLLFFLSYGHAYTWLRDTELGLSLGRHRYLAPLWWMAFTLAAVLVIRSRRDLGSITRVLNYVAGFALILPLLSITRFELQRTATSVEAVPSEAALAGLRLPKDQPPPDIYFIVLDAYAREDILRQVFNYDNSELLDYLRSQGFYVADDSLANHAQTGLSLAAVLNMAYVPDLLPGMDPSSENRDPLWELIQHSRVRQVLEDLGYTTVAFSTGLPGTEIQDADVFLTAGSLDEALGLSAINAFEGMLVESTAAKLLTDGSAALPNFFPDLTYPYRLHRARITNTFDQLERLPEMDGPKFVFAHIIAPHPPFVFGAQGQAVLRDQEFKLGFTLGDAGAPVGGKAYIEDYRDQISYVDTRVIRVVESLLANSDTPPIIILQADHGPEGRHPHVSYTQERMSILNSLFLPGLEDLPLQESLSPVNTFRLIFSEYFGAELPLLPDRALYSEYRKPYDFRDVTDQIE
jgi:hypothetical protein